MTFDSVRASKAAGGRARPLRRQRSALRADCPAVLGPVARRRTRFASFARYARTTAASQITKRADARGHEPCAPRRCQFAPEPTYPQPCGQRSLVFDSREQPSLLQARGQCPDGAHWRRGAAQRRGGSPARQRRTGEKDQCMGRVQRPMRGHRSRPLAASSAPNPRRRRGRRRLSPGRVPPSGPAPTSMRQQRFVRRGWRAAQWT
jgi:hypothetical protein